MRLTPVKSSGSGCSSEGLSQGVRRPNLGASLGWGLFLVACAAGCGPEFEADRGSNARPEATWESPLEGTNGLSTNGLSTNGLSTNGLSTNGLSTNGLSTNGLSTNGFSSWFDASPAQRDMVMRYVVRCAVPNGQSRSYTSPTTGVTYTWDGNLGLLPGWASGLPATETEQQVLTACLAAHANKYGVQIPISVLGRDATGAVVSYTTQELATYSEHEACFFGNIFTGDGLFAANDRAYLNSSESTSRACGLSSWDNNTDCLPVVHVGACSDFCTKGSDGTRPYYTQCTYAGKTYQPLTTRIRPSEIFRCGDGVCQFTEHCGTGATYDSCRADCGTCPP
ncbi:hypothetical protein JGU66_11830 [Myxococcaceae bacterium JPH2]|nr:hypothetical protein [Myxococcaceae bacterium JPH2]